MSRFVVVRADVAFRVSDQYAEAFDEVMCGVQRMSVTYPDVTLEAFYINHRLRDIRCRGTSPDNDTIAAATARVKQVFDIKPPPVDMAVVRFHVPETVWRAAVVANGGDPDNEFGGRFVFQNTVSVTYFPNPCQFLFHITTNVDVKTTTQRLRDYLSHFPITK